MNHLNGRHTHVLLLDHERNYMRKHLKVHDFYVYHPVTPPIMICVATEYFSAMGPVLLPKTRLHHWCRRAYSVMSTTSYSSSSLSASVYGLNKNVSDIHRWIRCLVLSIKESVVLHVWKCMGFSRWQNVWNNRQRLENF